MEFREYRIVTASYLGYECQYSLVWWPFWHQINISNTHETIEDAEEYIKKHKEKIKRQKFSGKFVKNV